MNYPNRLIFDSPHQLSASRKHNKKAERRFKRILTGVGCSEEALDELWILYKSGVIEGHSA